MTAATADIVRGVGDDQLASSTPCAGMTVGTLLGHVDVLCAAFTSAAAKESGAADAAPPSPEESRLAAGWRERIPARLDGLARAWLREAAWSGMTRAGGLDLPGEVAGAVAVDEVLVHGWDLAVATGQTFPGDDPALADAVRTVHDWVRQMVADNPGGTPGLFGPPVTVADDAPLFDRLLGMTGRDPSWRPDGG
ncbi:TIGR03086 family metal-binding protein [Nocardiopsis sp. FIRDI 009]|uniref:TIGR03086 family metal-binding protein n=1 Tax=Nocardiopsis sp. FIRDI 009 TaxID=714197 RepID=UPI001E3578D6|nr:TIGR03086 family metal-binding protein [Nocardiopsis sp. FIRDI 009]